MNDAPRTSVAFSRRIVRIEPGEAPSKAWQRIELPEGFREETDDEFRERVMREMEDK